MELLELYQLADENNISVYSFDLPQTLSMSVRETDGSCAIAIDPFGLDSTKDEMIRLAHELGHCVTGSFYNRYSDLDIREKSEFSADKWAIKKLIPKDELQIAFKQGYTEPWDLAEYFNVTEEFVIKAFNYYKNQLE